MNNNPILGKGELLFNIISAPKIDPKKVHPYDVGSGVERFAKQLKTAVEQVAILDSKLCVNEHAAVQLTMHPAYIAKSYMPEGFLRQGNMMHLGTKQVSVKPEKIVVKGEITKNEFGITMQTAQISVGVKKDVLLALYNTIKDGSCSAKLGEILRTIESVDVSTAQSKIIKVDSNDRNHNVFESVVYLGDQKRDLKNGFFSYMRELGVEFSMDRKFETEGLLFIPFKGTASQALEVAKFSYVRAIRNAPLLRALPGISLRMAHHDLPDTPIPDGDVDENDDLKVAIFDGGISPSSPLLRWCDAYECDGIGAPDTQGLIHGHAVTSALLFGPLGVGVPSTPTFRADHYRVLDTQTAANGDFMIYDVLDRIKSVLNKNNYNFVNLSLGPDIPVEDDEPNAWSCVLDEIFSHGDTLATVAGGNTGNSDWPSGLARVQPPSDAVNMFCIGAASTRHSCSPRADYSSIGPGRSPGIVRPEVINFGGSNDDPFFVFDESGGIVANYGTSFSAPYTLGTAAKIRAKMGTQLTPLAIKALIIHHTAESDTPDKVEAGWGVVNNDTDGLLSCGDDEIKVIFQDSLIPGTYHRTPIPIPSQLISGNVEIRITICLASEVDTEDPFNYTRSGVEVKFRPKHGSGNKGTQALFSNKSFSTEEDLRRDALKWETTLHSRFTKRGSSMSDPCIEVHCMGRSNGYSGKKGSSVKYAMIISLRAKQETQLYNNVVLRYPVLQQISPQTQISIQTGSN